MDRVNSLSDYLNDNNNIVAIDDTDVEVTRTEFESTLDSVRGLIMNSGCDIKSISRYNFTAFRDMCRIWFNVVIDEVCEAAIISNRIDILEKLIGDKAESIMKFYTSTMVQSWAINETHESSITTDSTILLENYIGELAQYTGVVYLLRRCDVVSVQSIKDRVISLSKKIINSAEGLCSHF